MLSIRWLLLFKHLPSHLFNIPFLDLLIYNLENRRVRATRSKRAVPIDSTTNWSPDPQASTSWLQKSMLGLELKREPSRKSSVLLPFFTSPSALLKMFYPATRPADSMSTRSSSAPFMFPASTLDRFLQDWTSDNRITPPLQSPTAGNRTAQSVSGSGLSGTK